jgi:S-adenosylmethionine:tRNA ribosyltransferase-isomerase
MFADRHIRDLPELVRGDELLVFNDTRVVPARLRGHKDTGGRVELLALESRGLRAFLALGKASKGFGVGQAVYLEGAPLAPLLIVSVEGDGRVVVRLPDDVASVWELCDRFGEVPLPPYMTRAANEDDATRYQTVFAREPGAVAAPTAGLHFTPTLLEALRARGCQTTFVTLHVGPGTFSPVRSERLSEHAMHSERYEVSATASDAIRKAKAEGRPVLAVGTTVVRTLEAVALTHGEVVTSAGETAIFIREGFRFRVVDQLLTNFHLPESTLLMLVSAFAGRERVLSAYRHAVATGYRFFSYGDGMLLR